MSSWRERNPEANRAAWRKWYRANAPECLHFHHDDPRQKDVTVAQAVVHGWSKQRILDEVAKCRVLCANCHAKHHWNERLELRAR
jgi:hypothetical protein